MTASAAPAPVPATASAVIARLAVARLSEALSFCTAQAASAPLPLVRFAWRTIAVAVAAGDLLHRHRAELPPATLRRLEGIRAWMAQNADRALAEAGVDLDAADLPAPYVRTRARTACPPGDAPPVPPPPASPPPPAA